MAKRAKKYLLNCNTRTGGAGMENWFISTFLYFMRHHRKLKWNPNEPAQRTAEEKNEKHSTNRTNEVSSMFFFLLSFRSIIHSVLLLVTDIKRKRKE